MTAIEKRKAMCLHCGLEVCYIPGDIDDQARVWRDMLAHDKKCLKNPLVIKIAKLEQEIRDWT
jgi:hypothetical protein